MGDVVNIDIDLLGLKNYVKITASGLLLPAPRWPLCWATSTSSPCKEGRTMPRIYKPVGPTSNKAAGPSATKTPAAAPAPEVKKPEVKKTETGGEK